ncbi:MAG: methylmalonyl-CoA mutase [Candidatus Schekmanbacteria bacterium]|nr:methylmalonyl-CoA mutase [Candidatus Schekmanbacteria bacterium]
MSESEREKRWRNEALSPAVAAGERRERFESSSQPVESLYTPASMAHIEVETDIGYPGQPPFTRGIYPTMYRGRLWTMRQYAGFGSAAETNQRFHYLLAQGQSGLSVAFDLPTQVGYDSDHELARGEVGRTGVAIDSIDDMDALFAGIPLDQVSTSMTINATAPILLALYAAVAKSRGIAIEKLRGTVQNDVLKEFVARGTYIYPPEASLKMAVDLLDYCSRAIPSWNPISVSGYHIREAGATAEEELAFTLADGLAYLDAARARGLDTALIARRISFFFAVHNNFVEEVAKFRAARRLWSELVASRYGITDLEARRLRFHAQTAGSTLVAQQPENNVVRVALQALAAVAGGCQSLHTNAMDEALALPTEATARLALRTQQVIAYETGIADTPDPFGGAYFLETMTDRLCAGAGALMQRIDNMGGMVAAIAGGFVQKRIHESAYRQQLAIESGDAVVVGVNRFGESGNVGAPALPGAQTLHAPDPEMEARQVAALRQLKARRDAREVGWALSAVARAAEDADNVVPAIMEAVTARATLGEISDALRKVYGEY